MAVARNPGGSDLLFGVRGEACLSHRTLPLIPKRPLGPHVALTWDQAWRKCCEVLHNKFTPEAACPWRLPCLFWCFLCLLPIWSPHRAQRSHRGGARHPTQSHSACPETGNAFWTCMPLDSCVTSLLRHIARRRVEAAKDDKEIQETDFFGYNNITKDESAPVTTYAGTTRP